MMKWFWRLGGLLAVVVVAALVLALVFRERLVGMWIEKEFAARLSQALGAEVEADQAQWQEGHLHVARLRLAGGALPFSSLVAEDVSIPLDWKELRRGVPDPLNAEATTATLVRGEDSAAVAAIDSGMVGGGEIPPLDFLINRFSSTPASGAGWSAQEVNLRVIHKAGLWSFSASGGTISAPGQPSMKLDRLSADHRGEEWSITSFALSDAGGGALGGSAVRDAAGQWSAEFAWYNLELAGFLGAPVNEHFAGLGSGDATMSAGTLRGHMRVSGATMRAVPAFIQMASLFAGEDWSVIPWEKMEFDFVRTADGTTSITNLEATSPKGLIVRGSGLFAPGQISAELNLGVRAEGRPWLLAFMPVLFRSQENGYLWTPVRVGGTPSALQEDLTARVVAALAVVPAGGAVETAAELPAGAVEAAGQLLRGFFGN
jgi:hypothetical protein